MTKLRLVIDTNILISGLMSVNSLPQQVFDYATSQAILLMSDEVQSEIENVISRPKLQKYITLERRTKFLSELSQQVERVTINQQIRACRDPKDDKFLELAVCGEANYIITGDADLLDLHPFQNISIIKAASFLTAIALHP
ncbi:putative toxin-antitoxin system toxin component, PIN family [Phormidium tenue]|jgi:putative PIN family toxin of toxin-antitoxin system|uniref:Toxin-antitoxin system toxin component, PIN family n=1 Tax=Phormidium tenue FACHB-1050 TaxID=2692857 RepID=A0ABR8CIL7_9CYAN|nr:putative toxin-antitoxin system toxin component, PIN family [Phormidium tenue]MBD2319875.1 putative toxin-antitoxin system toxin component, PIN family [Phormidium tenue FACHB-1050]